MIDIDIFNVVQDLAARNVLVGDTMLCKIADFGLSREIQQDDEEDQAQYTTEVHINLA